MSLPPELQTINALFDSILGPVKSPRPIDPQIQLENDLSNLKGWDYNMAWEVFHAFMRKTEDRYGPELSHRVERAMYELEQALYKAEDYVPRKGE